MASGPKGLPVRCFKKTPPQGWTGDLQTGQEAARVSPPFHPAGESLGHGDPASSPTQSGRLPPALEAGVHWLSVLCPGPDSVPRCLVTQGQSLLLPGLGLRATR